MITALPTKLWRRIAQWILRRRRELRLSVRMTVAGLLALLVAQFLNLPQGYWAVFAAVIVTETSVGGSVQAAVNWMIGTIGGAVYGAGVAALLPHGADAVPVIELALGLAPLTVLAALNPRFRVAPVTAIIVLATVNSSVMGPLQSAVDRVAEIGLGSFIGLGVSLLVLPSRANTLVAETAGRALEHMARLLTALTEAFGRHVGPDQVQPIHIDILDALSRLEDVVDEAVRERSTRLSSAPDPAPLPRTLHRVRNDLVMLGRAVPEPFPEVLAARLGAAFERVSAEIVAFLRACGVALRKRRAPPSRDALEAAFANFAHVLTAFRGEDLIRDQSDEMAGRIFALSFAMQQLRTNLKDLADRVAERTQV
jgi:uncharacterized membrane protein YccC